MGIPDYQSFMLPLLKFAIDDKEHTLKETYERLAREFNLTPEDKNVVLELNPFPRAISSIVLPG